MSKKKRFMVVDTETATLAFVNDLCLTAEDKKKIAIAKPLVYDIGWIITDRNGAHIDRKQFLVAETFSVPAIFNTAYYAEKRPIYLQMLQRGETTIKSWNEIMEIFIADMRSVDAVGAYNAMFDFKKAIPFTELYIRKLYSTSYYEWEHIQRHICENILLGVKPQKNDDFDPNVFEFRNEKYDLFDLWGLAARHLLNNCEYKRQCLEHEQITASGIYFKTSAESAYQYLCDKYDFVESHTALDDAIIETYILSKIAKRHAVEIGIIYFPFRELGYTDDFVVQHRHGRKYRQRVYDAIYAYCDEKTDHDIYGARSPYISQLVKRLNILETYC